MTTLPPHTPQATLNERVEKFLAIAPKTNNGDMLSESVRIIQLQRELLEEAINTIRYANGVCAVECADLADHHPLNKVVNLTYETNLKLTTALGSSNKEGE